jgi:hypothetical protein
MADYRQQLRQVSQEYDKGDRNFLELVTGQAAVGGGMIGDAVNQLIPAPVEQVINKGMMAVAESPVGQAIGQGYGYLQANYPRTTRGVTEALEASALAFPARTAMNPKAAMHKLSANLPNKMDFDLDPETGKYKTKFYLDPKTAEARAKERSPELFQRFPQQAVQFEQGLSRFNAVQKGFRMGLKNALMQSVSPKGQAKWREQGISKTMMDIPEDAPANVKFGQAGYERILGSQYDNVPELLKKLDDDYFTNEGVFNFTDFKKISGQAPEDAGAFFRTVMSNWKIKPGDDFLMIMRKPTGTEGSGDLVSDVMFKSTTGRILPSVFQPKTGFPDSKSFLNLYDLGKRQGSRQMSAEHRSAIKKTLDNNPEILNITDPAQFKQELSRALTKTVGTKDSFGVGFYVDAAFKKKTKEAFKSNDELAEALQAKGLKVNRNKDQKSDPDVYITDSVSSSAYELGGVNIVYKVSKDGKVTALVSDVNDLVGVGAPGGKKIITVVEPITKDLLNPTDRPQVKSTAVQEVYEGVKAPVKPKMQDYASAGANIGSVAAPVASGMMSGQQE